MRMNMGSRVATLIKVAFFLARLALSRVRKKGPQPGSNDARWWVHYDAWLAPRQLVRVPNNG